MDYKQILEKAVAAKSFNIKACAGLREALDDDGRNAYDHIGSMLKHAQLDYIAHSIVRNSFLIELVNHDITSTKFQVRWTDDLNDDPRFASYEECLRIAQKLLKEISALSKDDLLLLVKFKEFTSVPYELPFDYINRYADKLHSERNIYLAFNEVARSTVRLRSFLFDDSKNPDAIVFKEIYKNKVKIKTYLTDRAQTGLYQTNREKRWETHPRSVQFALRIHCMKIESKLLLQVAKFNGANADLVAGLKREGYLPSSFEYATCPITRDYLDYQLFVDDILHPRHGRSAFQVGHLNPLKTVKDGESFGHTATNISWISDDGNRIQGSLSMSEVERLLIRIFKNRHFDMRI